MNIQSTNEYETGKALSPSVLSSDIPFISQNNNASPNAGAQRPGYRGPWQALNRYWMAALRNHRLIMLVALLTTLLAVVVALFTNTTYTAKSTIKIETNPIRFLEYDVDTNRPPSYVDDTVFYNTQYKLLRSRDLATIVIDRLQIRDYLLEEKRYKPPVYTVIDPVRNFFSSLIPRDAEARDGAGEITAEDVFRDSLNVSPVRKSRIIDIHFTAQDAELARDVVNTLVREFVATQVRLRQQAAENAQKFLQDQISLARDKVQEAEGVLIEYAEANQIVDAETDEPIIAQNLETLSRAYMTAKEARIRAETQYRNKAGMSGTLNASDDPVVQEYKKELSELRNTYLANLELFKPAYPSMQSLQQRITALEQRIRTESSTIERNTRDNMKAAYQAALKEEEKLQAEIKALENNLLEYRKDNIQYVNLKRDVDASRSLYDGLLQRLKEISVVGTAQNESVTVVDKAIVPPLKDSPSYSKYGLLGLLGGIALALGWIFMREIQSPKVRSLQDIHALTGKYRVLSSLPRMEGFNPQKLASIIMQEPGSRMAEAIRYLRTSLLLGGGSRLPQVIHVTSALPGEGKTTTAVNLAGLLANAGKKVLLLDADLRRPAVHRYLELDNSQGLANYLGNQKLNINLARIRNSKFLFALCAGPAVADPVESLSSRNMAELLVRSRTVFDHIIIDSPPVVGMADALVLGNLSDGTLLVVANDRASEGQVDFAIATLEQSNSRILGIVHNMASKNKNQYAADYSDGREMLNYAM